MMPGQSLAGLTARVLEALDPILTGERPAMIVVRTDRQTATVPSSKSMCSHRSARASSVRIPVVKDSTTYALVR